MDSQKNVMILGHVPLLKGHPDFGLLTRHPGRWVLDQAVALSQHTDYKVTLATVVKGATDDHETQIGNLRVIYLKAQPRFRVWTLFFWDIYRLRSLIKSECPDLVHVHGIEDAYALTAYRLNIPKVLTLQSLYQDYNDKNPVKWYSAPRLIECLEKRALRGFSSAIIKSRQFQKVVKEYHPTMESEIVPNTLSQVFLEVPVVSIQRNKLAFVGTICARKGFHVIREALGGIDSDRFPLELNVYGDGGATDYIINEIEAIEATGHKVINHGSVGAEQLAAELASSNMLIAPSYAETFGNQVIEAMLCRCHCIVSDDTGMAENIRKYGHGTIVPQREADEIVKAINNQLAQGVSEQEMRMRELTRTKVIDDLGPEKVALQLQAIYRKNLG